VSAETRRILVRECNASVKRVSRYGQSVLDCTTNCSLISPAYTYVIALSILQKYILRQLSDFFGGHVCDISRRPYVYTIVQLTRTTPPVINLRKTHSTLPPAAVSTTNRRTSKRGRNCPVFHSDGLILPQICDSSLNTSKFSGDFTTCPQIQSSFILKGLYVQTWTNIYAYEDMSLMPMKICQLSRK
jgi:hypothetical protein